MSRLTHTNMNGLDREHALMLTGVLPTLMLNHLQSHDDKYRCAFFRVQHLAQLSVQT